MAEQEMQQPLRREHGTALSANMVAPPSALKNGSSSSGNGNGEKERLVEMTYALLGLGNGSNLTTTGAVSSTPQQQQQQQQQQQLHKPKQPEEETFRFSEEIQADVTDEQQPTPMVEDDDDEEEGELEIKEEEEEEEEEEEGGQALTVRQEPIPSPPERHSLGFILNHHLTNEEGDQQRASPLQNGKRKSEDPDYIEELDRGHPSRSPGEEEDEDDNEMQQPPMKKKKGKGLSPARILASLATLDAAARERDRYLQSASSSTFRPLRPVVHNGYGNRHPAEELSDTFEHLPGPSSLLPPASSIDANGRHPAMGLRSRPLPEKLQPLRLQDRLAKQMAAQQMKAQQVLEMERHGYYDTAYHGDQVSPPVSPAAEVIPQAINGRQHQHLDVEEQLMMRKRRKRATADQVAFLEASFAENPLPDTETKNRIAHHLGMTTRRVTIWYQNKRARIKRELKKKRATQTQPQTQLNAPSTQSLDAPPPLTDADDSGTEVYTDTAPNQPNDPQDGSHIRPFLQRKAKQNAKVRR